MRHIARAFGRWFVLSIAVTGTPAMAESQSTPVATWTWRPSADPVVARADSISAAGDTVKAIALLESSLRSNNNNAAVWHRYGILQWQRFAKARSGGFIGDSKVINGLRIADSALRLATKFAPDSAEYWATLGRFNLQSGVATMRFSAERQMQQVYEAASRVGDSVFISEGADELGMAIWRRFESIRNRALVNDAQKVQFQTDGRFPRALAWDNLTSFAKRIEPPTGAVDYAAAMEQFGIAMRASPRAQRYSRHVYMGLAANKQWDALLELADARGVASTFDADARLARGLALQRLRRTPEAHLAFDSALALIDEDERAFLFRIDRLLPTTPNVLTGKRGMDKQALAAIPAAERATMSALFWALNDPLTTTAENEARSEFMARVVQAEWHWSDLAQGLHGVDTDRGDIFVRYGPPDEEMTVPGTASVQQTAQPQPENGATTRYIGVSSTSQEGGSTLAWHYRSGESFFFELAPGFGTGRTPLTDQKYVADVTSVKPAAWDNIAVPRRVDTLSVRTVRFRAQGDSTDVVIVTRLPLRTLSTDELRSLDPAAGTVRVDFTVVDGAARTVSRDSSRTPFAPDSIANGGMRSWVRRVGAGAAFMRVEAVHTAANSDAQRSANAVAAVEAERARGFGISDVLLVQVGGAPPASAERWRDLGVTPSAGEYRAGEKLGLAWEAYELGAVENANRYRVAITVERAKRSRATGLALRVLDGVGGLVKQEKGSADKLSVSFDRNVAAKATQVEYLSLDWLGDARGEYRLRIDVTDLVTNRTATRETRFRIQ